ncbi:MAG: hypothetical protein H7234_04595 [Herminiimonas sp.]|nr:hypothetical protein [Herminiimonas sp.]
MTTATTQYFNAKPAATNPLLAIVSFLLSVHLRETLAAESTAQADTGAYTWGM